MMKFQELPDRYKTTALNWAVDAINELYRENGEYPVEDTAPEVVDLAEDWEYEIETGEYEDGIRYERLVRL